MLAPSPMPPMPSQQPPPGGPPGGLPGGPPGGTGSAAVPGRMAGGAAQGANLLRAGLEMLQKALPMLQLGSDEHNETIKAVGALSKVVGKIAGAGDPAAMVQQLAQLARSAQQAPVPPAMSGGGAPPSMGAPPMAA